MNVTFIFKFVFLIEKLSFVFLVFLAFQFFRSEDEFFLTMLKIGIQFLCFQTNSMLLNSEFLIFFSVLFSCFSGNPIVDSSDLICYFFLFFFQMKKLLFVYLFLF